MKQIERSTITPERVVGLIIKGYTFTLMNTTTKKFVIYKSGFANYNLIIAARNKERKRFTVICNIQKGELVSESYTQFLFDKELKMLRTFWCGLRTKEVPTNIEFWHPCKCRRCKRLLTDPRSIEKGIGPGCKKKENKGGAPC